MDEKVAVARDVLRMLDDIQTQLATRQRERAQADRRLAHHTEALRRAIAAVRDAS